MLDIRADGGGRLVLSGRFDAAQAEHASRVFRDLESPTIVDCSGLDYISSAGIAVIMDAFERLAGRGHALRLEKLAPRVRDVFVFAGLDRVLGIP